MGRCFRHCRAVALPLLALVAACSSGRTNVATPPAPAHSSSSGAAVPSAYRLERSEAFTRAVASGTRTETGAPGPRYWTQYASYRLTAELNPVVKRLTGRGKVTYYNRSPDTLAVVYVHAYQNLFQPDARRNMQTPRLGGMEFTRVAAQGQPLTAEAKAGTPGYQVNGTIMEIRLPRPLAPRDSLPLEFAWQFRVQAETAPRGGQDGEVWFISYWYPQLAVYDDLNGWQIDPYLGRGEFYMGYADYDVAVSVPTGWLVGGTGTLQNPAEVLSPETRARLDSARTSGAVVHVVTDKDRADSTATTRGRDGKLTWRFRARNVRDFDWGTSSRYNWDATRAIADSARAADTVAIHTFYRTEGKRSYWDEAARYARYSIDFYSRLLWPYPYPHMTAMDGPEGCGGMEFPMVTCIGGTWGDSTTMYEVVTHEIGHMWFPMQVGSDENRYAWMDEGFAQYEQSQSMDSFFQPFDDEARNRQNYLRVVAAGLEEESMKPSDRFNTEPGYGAGAYYKPASVLVALREVLGRETFERAFREYGRRWLGKHPSPYDFFNTFEDVARRDLSWFWREWFFETWRLDQALDSVGTEGDSVAIVVANRGKAIMPVPLAITREGGKTDRVTIPVDVWFDGAKRYTLKVPAKPTVTKVELDPDHAFPDVNRGDEVWPRGQGGIAR